MRGHGVRLGRLAWAVVGVSLLVCAAQLSPAGAGKPKKTASTASGLRFDADSVMGSVLSARSECKGGRKVSLRSTAGGKQALAKATTNKKGHWDIPIQLGPGTYFADVQDAIRTGRANGRQVRFHCRAVRSAPTTL